MVVILGQIRKGQFFCEYCCRLKKQQVLIDCSAAVWLKKFINSVFFENSYLNDDPKWG